MDMAILPSLWVAGLLCGLDFDAFDRTEPASMRGMKTPFGTLYQL